MELLNKKIWDKNIYNIISSSQYISSLELQLKLNLISFDINNKVSFNQKLQISYSGVWTESKWYWFGYWKLHIGHVECEIWYELLKLGSVGIAAIKEAMTAAGFGWLSAVLAGLLAAYSFILNFRSR
ncbi:hypothetical protein SPE_0912 [Spiroplasma eriocheiris CCTCC M 207170]|nr:hypothetical protein SPE_0912 [Spiroplasma eriocheiris CCTCC M 207170]